MPQPPAMRNRVIRVGDQLWTAAMQKATERHESLSAVIRTALERYTKDENHGSHS
jgi:hypothetical protein